MLRILLIMLSAYTLASCGGETPKTTEGHGHEHHDHNGHNHDDGGHDHHDHGEEGSNEVEGDSVHYGVEITQENSIGLEEAIKLVESGEGAEDLEIGKNNIVKAISAKVEGKVTEVCKKAGCWLRITSVEGSELFVNTNHDFFVPVGIIGKTVVVEGSAFKTTTSVEELRHYAEDEGKSDEEIAAISEPKSEYELLAKGLVLKY